MILEGILGLVKSVLLFVIGLFPPLPDLNFLSHSLAELFNLLILIDSIVSVRLFGFCLGALFVFSHIDFMWSVVMWVVKKIPGVS